MKSIAKKNLPKLMLRRDTSFGSTPIGEYESTVELFDFGKGNYQVEWDLPDLMETEHIGIIAEFDHDTRKLVIKDYDGVFEVPEEIIKFLEENKFDCEYCK